MLSQIPAVNPDTIPDATPDAPVILRDPSSRPAPTANDVRAVAVPVLSHRIIRNYAAVADGITSSQLVHQIVQSVPEPNYTR